MERSVVNKKNRKYGKGKPKRLRIMKKSRHMRRWLVRNPWIKPLSVFNFAAVMIQKHMRGCIQRIRNLNKGSVIKKKGSGKTKSKTNQQLDKYLMYLDKCKHKLKIKPLWLDGGYSTWCAVKIQSIYRMRKVYVRYRRTKQLISQVAGIIIQTAWRNHVYYLRMKNAEEPRVRTPHTAARAIQLRWRSYCNRRIYRYFRDLIKNKLKGAPYDLLRTIIPNESSLLDRACGAHVRFRLGGWIFPPKVYFKIYTHRPLCDVGSFAPRDYTAERRVDDKMVHNKLMGHLDYTTRSTKMDTMRVGTRYFDTVVSTTSAAGTSNWYKRDENNAWRAISTSLFENILAPPWYRESGHVSKPKQFHFSSQTRIKELKRLRNQRKRQWLVKAFLMKEGENGGEEGEEEGGGVPLEDPERDNFSEQAGSRHSGRSQRQPSPSRDERPFPDSVANSELLNELFFLNKKISDQNDRRLVEARTQPVYPNGHFKTLNLLRASSQGHDLTLHNDHILSPKGRHSPHGRSDVDYYHKEPVSPKGAAAAAAHEAASLRSRSGLVSTSLPNAAGLSVGLAVKNESYARMKADLEAGSRRVAAKRAAVDAHEDLVDWSQALNFDLYADAWSSLGTSMPSDVKSDAMYHLAASTNKELRVKFYGNNSVPYHA